MASATPDPYLRAPVLPVRDPWAGETGFPWPMIRFALWCSWESPKVGQRDRRVLGMALLAPELPVSVLPLSLRRQHAITVDQATPPGWQDHPRLPWRGISSPVGQTQMRLVNHIGSQTPLDVSLVVLLPPLDPPGSTPQFALLGMDFFKHYNVRVTLDYPAIVYRIDPVTGRPDVDPFSPCGCIEVF